MNKNTLFYGKLTLILMAALLLSLAGNVWQWHELQNQDPVKTDTITVVEWCEVKDNHPTAAEKRNTGRQLTVQTYKRPVVPTDSISTPTASCDSLPTYSINSDSTATVHLPVTQSIYRDSLYTAWVSGYMAQLDSISVRERRETITITRYRRGHWHWGVNAGVGVGVWSHQPDMYFGIGVGYSF